MSNGGDLSAEERERGEPHLLSSRSQTGKDTGNQQQAVPRHIPATTWKDIVLRTWRQINEDRIPAVAAGVVFYALLALFPAITALVSSYALFAKGSTITGHLAFLSGVLPAGAFDIVKDQVDRVLAKGDITLGATFLFTFLLALWSANGGVKALIDALNVAYEEKERRGFFRLNAVSLAFTVGSLIAALIAIGAIVALPILLSAIGLDAVTDTVVRFGRWPVLVVLILLGFAVLYRYGPSHRAPHWRWISPGSVFAMVTWLIGSALLSFYLSHYAHYDAVYGSLGTAIGLMMWMWMSATVVLMAAELDAEIARETGRSASAGTKGLAAEVTQTSPHSR